MSTAAGDLVGSERLVGRTAEEAVSELATELGGKVFAFGMKFCGNREDAEDLVQETFLQAFRKWDQFEGRSSPSSWLYTIAARACQRRNRKRAGEPPRLASLDEELPTGLALGAKLPSPDDGPLEEELRKEAVEIVDQALARLPEDYRLPLVLKEIAELSLREIAEILEIKKETVKTRVHRGRLALRAELVQNLAEEHHLKTDHSEQVCLDLLQSKMEAMDRGAEFPVRPEDLCERCGSFLQSLDLAADACRWVHGGEMPERLRSRLRAGFDHKPTRRREPGLVGGGS